MNREIKFDIIAWDGENKNTIEHMDLDEAFREGVVVFDSGGPAPIDDTVIIRQYTGLKDVNGTEIYEGDIVRWVQHSEIYDHEGVDVVVFKDGCFYPIGHDGHTECYTRGKPECEVIGNIYENPELLEKDGD